MAKRQFTIAFLLITCATIICIVMFKLRPEPAKHEVTQRIIKVEALSVYKQSETINLIAHGVVSPHTETILMSEVSGQILSVSPKLHSGGFFKKGEMLLTIDDTRYQANLRRREADLASAKNSLAQELSRAEVARRDWERAGKPGKTEAARSLATRKPQLEEAQARVVAANAELTQARSDLEKTTIRSPYNALLRNKQADIGQYINNGTPLATLYAIDYVEVRLPIPESRLNYLELPETFNQNDNGANGVVTLTAQIGGQQQQWQGVLHRTEGVLTESTKTLHLVARVNDPYQLDSNNVSGNNLSPLRIGTFLEASIPGKPMANLIALPRHLLQAGNKLWVIDSSNTLREKKVTTLKTGGKEIYISDGLENGDKVCLTPVGNVFPGTKVEITALKSQLAESSPQTRPDITSETPTTEAAERK